MIGRKNNHLVTVLRKQFALGKKHALNTTDAAKKIIDE
jgi:hypothetical protein